MRFKQFISEQSFTNLELSKAFTSFKNATGDIPLYRGIKLNDNGKKAVQKLPHPINRAAKDSSEELVCIFNAMIDAAFKIKDVRSHSIFCSGSEASASQYGDVYEIAPIGDYKYLWAPLIRDSFTNEYRIWEQVSDTLAGFYPKASKRSLEMSMHTLFQKLCKSITSSSWVHDSSQDKNLRELFVDLDFADVLGIDTAVDEQFPALLKQSLNMAGTELYQNNEGLEEAISLYKEILIYQSAGYFAVPKRKHLNNF
jgi:hypothetical protein